MIGCESGSGSVALGFRHDSGLVTVQMLDVGGHAVIRDTDDHLIGLDGGPLPASETSDGDVGPAGDDRDSLDILAAALERCGGEFGTASAGGGLQGDDPVDPLGDVRDDDHIRDEIGVLQGAGDLSFGLERDEETFVDHLFGGFGGIVSTDVEVGGTGGDVGRSVDHSEDTCADVAGFLFNGKGETFALGGLEDCLTVGDGILDLGAAGGEFLVLSDQSAGDGLMAEPEDGLQTVGIMLVKFQCRGHRSVIGLGTFISIPFRTNTSDSERTAHKHFIIFFTSDDYGKEKSDLGNGYEG